MPLDRGKPDRQFQRKLPYPGAEGRRVKPFPTENSAPRVNGSLAKPTKPSIQPPLQTAPVKHSTTLAAPPRRTAEPTPTPRSLRRFIRRLFRSLRRLLAGLKNWLVWLFTRWQFLIFAGFLTCVSSALLAIAFIFQLPALPNCPAVFWPLASASMRFECARIAASKQTAKDLLEAIALVDGLPAGHAMRPEADRMIELWSQEVLKLAEELFHKGELDEAIAAAQKIPTKVTAYRLVQERVQRWRTIWAKAEGIYKKAEAALRKRDWRDAFQLAVGLLDIDNKYWQTTRYDDLNNRINTSRVDGNKLFKAEWLADEGTVSSLLQAIKLAREIRPDSYIYDLAQVKIQFFGRKLLDLAQKSLDRRNLQEALSIINQIPPQAKVESEKRDLTVLANAYSLSWQDSVVGLEAAIAQAQRVLPGRPLYAQAQKLILRWQYEIEGVAQIERARLLAQNGTVEGFLNAIAAASQVSSANPRWNEAQREIQKWTAATQTIADRPILDQAEQFASSGDIDSLQAAISQADQIAPGRALYNEAQSRVREWTRQIQQTQDQPYLDQARAFAFAGNLKSAISVAEQIRPGRSLYNEAQADIAKWRSQIREQVEQAQAQVAQAQAQQSLQEARQLASVGNPNSLVSAIRLASQIPSSGSVQAEINAAINEWSWQLLQQAKDQAVTLNLAGAIAIAQKIPSRAAAYAEAQANIQTWQHQSVKQ
ncbi:MAG: chromosome segregation ATPase [Oscillatoriales cyanobacterium C42_A2020_001]|nr:chromosome segregation ATPase [Leptolyngbyaceae cyanobacterium C42_A2020_001]